MAAQANGVDLRPDFIDAFPHYNPLDTLRCGVAEELAKLSGVEKSLIFPSLAFANTLDKGDLVLAVPRLRIKGKKPQELAEEWAANVELPVAFRAMSLKLTTA